MTREQIEALLAGLEGVTPGPYVISQDTHKWIDTIGLAAENCWSDNRDADAAHFSRCDPDTIRELCRLALIGLETDRNHAGKEPCGKCHIRPGETCGICGAFRPDMEPTP